MSTALTHDAPRKKDPVSIRFSWRSIPGSRWLSPVRTPWSRAACSPGSLMRTGLRTWSGRGGPDGYFDHLLNPEETTHSFRPALTGVGMPIDLLHLLKAV